MRNEDNPLFLAGNESKPELRTLSSQSFRPGWAGRNLGGLLGAWPVPGDPVCRVIGPHGPQAGPARLQRRALHPRARRRRPPRPAERRQAAAPAESRPGGSPSRGCAAPRREGLLKKAFYASPSGYVVVFCGLATQGGALFLDEGNACPGLLYEAPSGRAREARYSTSSAAPTPTGPGRPVSPALGHGRCCHVREVSRPIRWQCVPSFL